MSQRPKVDRSVPLWLGQARSLKQMTEQGLGTIDRHVFRRRSGRWGTERVSRALRQDAPHSSMGCRRRLTIKVAVIERISEGLKTVHAAPLADRRTHFNYLHRSGEHLAEAGEDLLEQTRAAGHRIVEHRVGGLRSRLPKDEDLEVFAIHVQHLRGANAEGLRQ